MYEFLYKFFISDIRTNLIIITIISFVVYKISKFYYQVYSLPPGPFPLPFIGNILLFRRKKEYLNVLDKVNIKHGPVYTIWFGSVPCIVICDADIGRKVLSKNAFSGKPQAIISRFFTNDEFQNVGLTEGEVWETLRKVTHSSILKFATNDKLIDLVAECVDTTVKHMIEREGINKGFKINEYIYSLFVNIIANTAFGEKFEQDDEYSAKLMTFIEELDSVFRRAILWEVSPLIRLMDHKFIKSFGDNTKWLITETKNKFINHYKDYDQSIERDFCDALITAKNNALKENKESAIYLTEVNLAMCVFDIFIGGIDNFKLTFEWILLFISNYPEIQEKLRKEIELQIGERIPTLEDRDNCHYVMAFIMEILRFRIGLTLFNVRRVTSCNKIGDYTIPEGMLVYLHQDHILKNEKYWTNAHEFRPERFLENEKFITTRNKAFVPFGVGRRVCLGDKLAIATIFLVLVRFLQSTSDYTIVLGQNNGVEPNLDVTFLLVPYEYEIIFKPK